MEREKYDDSIRRDSIGIGRGLLVEDARLSTTFRAAPVVVETTTSTGRPIPTQETTAAAPTPGQPK